MNFNKAKFITFEGCDGSGKSTQSKMLYEYLLSLGIDVIITREIGGTEEGEKIRQIILYSDLLPMSELMLIMAARYEHIYKIIIPALKLNKWVICDRFIDSTAAYQGSYNQNNIKMIYDFHQKFMSNIMPNLTFFIDIPTATALKRIDGRDKNDKFENKNIEFHQKISEMFCQIAKASPMRIARIEAQNLSAEKIHDKIISALQDFVKDN
jgi:dTMP kinase